jgi:pimeloyl-ACP methyl ester carboxylesterase
MMTTEIHAVEAATLEAANVRFSALAAGPKDAPILLCLHGMPASSELWRDALPLFAAAGFRAIAPDLGGFGATRCSPSWRPSLGANADALCDWLATTPQQRAWWIGHDLGGAIAQLALARRPGCFSRLTLSNCPHGLSFPVPAVTRLRSIARLGLYPLLACSGLMSGRRSTSALRVAFADRSQATSAVIRRVFWDDKVHSREGRAAFASFLTALDENSFAKETAALRAQVVPIQLVWGMRDRYQPWSTVGEALAKQLGQVEIVKLEQCGHFGPLEAPAAFVAAVLGFAPLVHSRLLPSL